MRNINDFVVNELNDTLRLTVQDEPGNGGACHSYLIESKVSTQPFAVSIQFQKGPISECGVNGISHEVLLSIIADRLRSFQAGTYSSKENAIALTHIEGAQNWLNRRTLDRMGRNVEGTSKL